MSTTAELSRALFGDYVNAEIIAKMNPGVSDVHSFGESNRAGTPVLRGRRTGRRQVRKADSEHRTGKKVLAGAGIGATLVGGALGTKELLEQAPKAAKVWRTKRGWVHPATTGAKLARIPRVGPAGRVAGVGLMLGGDVVATGEQMHALHGRRPGEVEKGFQDMVRGIMTTSRLATAVHAPQVVRNTEKFGEQVPHLQRIAQKKTMIRANRNPATRKMVQSYGGHQGANERLDTLRANRAARQAAAPVAKPKKTGFDRAMDRGTAVRADIGRMASTTSGKVALGIGGGAVGLKAVRRVRARGGDGGSYADPYAVDPYAGYAKRDSSDEITVSGTFSKFDDDRRLAFGWANVSKVNGMPVVDRQGDYCAIEDIEDAAYTYVERSRVGGDMHRRVGGKSIGAADAPHHVADLVESMVFDDDKCDALGLPDDFPRGWWVGFRVFDDDVWEMAKDGRRAGFSIHGKGIRKNVDYDSIMGY